MKGAIRFRGVKMADIRACLHAWLESESVASTLTPYAQTTLSFELLRQTYCEDKLAGIPYQQELRVPQGAIKWERDLPRFAGLFKGGCIHERNTCDWLCVKTLGALALTQGEPCARAIAAWSGAEHLWQCRAAAVAFINLAAGGDTLFPGSST